MQIANTPKYDVCELQVHLCIPFYLEGLTLINYHVSIKYHSTYTPCKFQNYTVIDFYLLEKNISDMFLCLS